MAAAAASNTTVECPARINLLSEQNHRLMMVIIKKKTRLKRNDETGRAPAGYTCGDLAKEISGIRSGNCSENPGSFNYCVRCPLSTSRLFPIEARLLWMPRDANVHAATASCSSWPRPSLRRARWLLWLLLSLLLLLLLLLLRHRRPVVPLRHWPHQHRARKKTKITITGHS